MVLPVVLPVVQLAAQQVVQMVVQLVVIERDADSVPQSAKLHPTERGAGSATDRGDPPS